MDLLEPSDRKTRCAYKGIASYRHVVVDDAFHAGIAWTYAEPRLDGSAIRNLICCLKERVDPERGGVAEERPVPQWSP